MCGVRHRVPEGHPSGRSTVVHISGCVVVTDMGAIAPVCGSLIIWFDELTRPPNSSGSPRRFHRSPLVHTASTGPPMGSSPHVGPSMSALGRRM